MKKSINVWAFIFSVICIFLLFTVSFSEVISRSILGIHPLTIVLSITLITLMFGVIGFSGIQDWKGMIRSVATIIITLVLSAFISIVLLFGSLLS